MKILIDNFGTPNSGIYRFTKEIIKKKPSNINLQNYHRNNCKLYFYPLKLNKVIKRKKPDIVWSQGFIPPFNPKIPSIITIHDLNHLKLYSLKHKFYYNWIIKPLCRNKNIKITTVSEASRVEISKWLNIPMEEIKVIYLGVSDIFFSDKYDKYGHQKPYFLYVGNKLPYKNIKRMLISFSQAKTPCDFLLTGEPNNEILNIIDKLKIKSRVFFTGHVNDRTLKSLYKGATSVVFISLGEGFGLPNAEALACGTNIITSNISSMPEIVGEHGIKVNPYKTEEITKAMEIAHHEHLNETTEKRKIRSIYAAKNWTWDRTAKKMWDLISKTHQSFL